MRNANSVKTVALRAVLIAAVVICCGCPHINPKGTGVRSAAHNPHNLAGLHCGNNHVPKDYSVEVLPNSQVLKDSDNLVIFVCESDSLDWHTADATNVIKVVFTDPFADELFDTSETKFELRNSDHRIDSNRHKVKKQVKHERYAYKYTIEIDDKDGNCLGKLDPHVIPMGK